MLLRLILTLKICNTAIASVFLECNFNLLPTKRSPVYIIKMDPKSEENSNYGTAGICNNLNNFRKQNIHCDVELQIGEKTYPCHKIVIAACSKHFETMFTSSFREKDDYSIRLLGDIDPSLFEEVIEFLYIADIKFTEENAYGLLRTSHYLQIEELENRCCNYIFGNQNVKHLPEICEYSRKIGKNDFVEIVIKHIVSTISCVRKSKNFVNISLATLSDIVKNAKQRNYPKCRKEFVDAVFDWTNFNWSERKCYLKDLMKYVAPSGDCLIHFIDKFSEIISIQNENCISPTLGVFCETESNSSQSIDQLLCKEGAWIWKKNICEKKYIKTTRFEDRDYFLSWNEDENQFWAEGDSAITLKPPSITTKNYDIIMNGETMFLYKSCNRIDCNPNSTKPLHHYNFDLNTWFTVQTSIPEHLHCSYLAAIDKVIYLIGGCTDFHSRTGLKNVMQSYDKRSNKWFTKSFNKNFLLNGTVTTYKNEIFIYEKINEKEGCLHVYNPVGGKFRPLKQICTVITPGILVSSDHELWYIENKLGGMVYNVLDKGWKELGNTPSVIETWTGSAVKLKKIESAVFY